MTLSNQQRKAEPARGAGTRSSQSEAEATFPHLHLSTTTTSYTIGKRCADLRSGPCYRLDSESCTKSCTAWPRTPANLLAPKNASAPCAAAIGCQLVMMGASGARAVPLPIDQARANLPLNPEEYSTFVTTRQLHGPLDELHSAGSSARRLPVGSR